MPRILIVSVIGLSLLVGSPCKLYAQKPLSGFRLPEGFQIVEMAGPELANDIYSLSIDNQGRVIVGGPGYVRWLVDDSGNGVADRAVDLVDGVKGGPMGIFWDQDDLYAVVDGGLKLFANCTGDKPAKVTKTLIKLRAASEHDAHAVKRGPDGWLYLLCGNMAGVNEQSIQGDHSPIKRPRAGALIRFSPDTNQVEVVCDGFRNPYDFDFDIHGEPFTYDSDNERCIGLPWYEGCRLYHMVPGANHGWRTPQRGQTWRLGPQMPDISEPVVDTHRGSPTGMAFYNAGNFPEQYLGGAFLADWTFGQILFVPIEAAGSSYAGKVMPFLATTGDNGFAPTGLAVDPKTGDLIVSIGGRGTRGGVYRIQYTESSKTSSLEVTPPLPLEWQDDLKPTILERIGSDQLKQNRIGLEHLLRHIEQFSESEIRQAIDSHAGQDDRLIRFAVGRLIRASGLKPTKLHDSRLSPEWLVLDADRLTEAEQNGAVRSAIRVLQSADVKPTELLEAVRAVQLAAGDLISRESNGTVFEGYSVQGELPKRLREAVLPALRNHLSAQQPQLKYEVFRTLAALADNEPSVVATFVSVLESDASVLDKEHAAFCLAACHAKLSESQSRAVAEAFLQFDAGLEAAGIPTDRHWPTRIRQSFHRLAGINPELPTQAIESPRFSRPIHVLLVPNANEYRTVAAKRFVGLEADGKLAEWTAEMVQLLTALPAKEYQPVVRSLWDADRASRDALLTVLAKQPDQADLEKFGVGLRSPIAGTVGNAARALTKLNVDADLILPAFIALRRFNNEKEHQQLRANLAKVLESATGQRHGTDTVQWENWLNETRPELSEQLATATGYNPKVWQSKLAGVDWEAADAANGQKVFHKAQCAACHNGARAVGPSLEGVAKRFSRDDLLISILDPDRDVSPRYQAVRIVTEDERIYEGIVIYEANDGLILQTGPEETVRIAGDNIAVRAASSKSLMPAGLLDTNSAKEVADLMAYLRTLGTSPR